MTYASGGLIEAVDFNNIVGGSVANVSTQLNTVWAVGRQTRGYGQTAISNVSVSGTVAATNWASLINSLNNARLHQSGSGSGLSAPTAGTTVTFLSTLTSAVSTAYTNALLRNAAGTTVTGTTSTKSGVASSSVSNTVTFTTRFSFASADQARYFFNAGGLLRIELSGFVNNNGTLRSASMGNLITPILGFGALGAVSTTNFTTQATPPGTNTSNLTCGYYTLPGNKAAQTQYFRRTSGGYYSGDYVSFFANVSGAAGSNQDQGTEVALITTLFSSTTGSTQPPDSLNYSITATPRTIYPPTTYLSNTWGSVTMTTV